MTADLQLARAALDRGNELFHSPDWQNSWVHYETAARHFREAGDAAGLADALCNLASMAWRNTDLDRAQGLYETSRELYVLAEAWWHVATVEQYLGNVAYDLGDLHRAGWHYERARLGLRGVNRSPLDVADLDVNHAALLAELGDHDRAIALLDDARTVYTALLHGDDLFTKTAQVDQNRGLAHAENEHLSAAWRDLSNALHAYRRLGDRDKVADLLHNLADTARRMGRGPTATRLYLAAIDTYESTGHPHASADSRLGFGAQLHRDGDDTPAAVQLDAAAAAYTATGQWLALTRAVHNRGLTRTNGSPARLDDLVPALLATQSITWGLTATDARAHWRDSVDHALDTTLDSALAAGRPDLVADLVENARATTVTPRAAVPAGITGDGDSTHDLTLGRPPLVTCGWPAVLQKYLRRAEELRNVAGTDIRLRTVTVSAISHLRPPTG